MQDIGVMLLAVCDWFQVWETTQCVTHNKLPISFTTCIQREQELVGPKSRLKKKKAHSLTKHSKLYKDIQIYRHCFFMKQRSSGTGDSCHNKITQLSKALMLEIGYQSLSYERHDGEGRGNMANNLNEQ